MMVSFSPSYSSGGRGKRGEERELSRLFTVIDSMVNEVGEYQRNILFYGRAHQPVLVA